MDYKASYSAEDRAVLAQIREFAEAERDGTAIPALVSLGPFTAYTLAGMIQLACRHPQTSGEIRAVARDLVAQLMPLFGDGAVARSIERGWTE